MDVILGVFLFFVVLAVVYVVLGVKANEMRLKDKIAIVTGSRSGLGKAMAKRLAEEGA